MKTTGFFLTTVLLIVTLVATTSQATLISASDDTWVREDNPDSNRNGNNLMNVRTNISADDNDVILLRFPTTALTDAALSATLNLYWQRDSSSTHTMSLWGLNETDPDETTWSETTVTYNNAPGMLPDGLDPLAEFGLGNTDDDIRDLDSANLTLLVENQDYGPAVLNQVYTFSSAALTSFINADTNGEVSLLITRGVLNDSGNQARFWPKEQGAATAPTLDVTVVPEPTTLALLGVGGLAILLRRRPA